MSAPTVRFADAPPAKADVVVIGGGVIGCATAFFAASAGLRVVVLERRAALGTLTTPASTGAFRLQFDNPEEISTVREGVELFDAFAERTGLDGWDLGLRHGGYLFCSLTDATLERSRRLVARQRDWGLTDVELLSGDEARARWPWLSDDVLGARYRAGDGWLVNTVESSPSGNEWGMPLRMLLDSGAVQAGDVALVGARNLDPPEVEFIAANGVGTGHEAVASALEGTGGAYVAVDFDALTEDEVAAFMPEPDGLSLEEAEQVLADVRGRTDVLGTGLSGLVPDERNLEPARRLTAALGL